tara:strand:+ start:330 stop:761 length:432 start_codon:yes stop_codon:yes gene_type:complete
MNILLPLFFALIPTNTEVDIYDLHDALWAVESSRMENPPDGDGGKAIGPYQIWHAYWQDAYDFDESLGGTYEDCRDRQYALKVMHCYWRRYCPNEFWRARDGRGTRKDFEVLARIHNGGPRGHKREITVKYWDKVKKELYHDR